MSVRELFRSLGLSNKTEEIQGEETEAHKRVVQCLDTIYRMVEQDAPVCLDTNFEHAANINCEDWVLNNDGSYSESWQPCFFRPWALSRLRDHPLDTHSTWTQQKARAHEDCWEGVPEFEESYLDEADFMCSMM